MKPRHFWVLYGLTQAETTTKRGMDEDTRERLLDALDRAKAEHNHKQLTKGAPPQ